MQCRDLLTFDKCISKVVESFEFQHLQKVKLVCVNQIVSYILVFLLYGQGKAIFRVLIFLTGITVDLLYQELYDLSMPTTGSYMDWLGVRGVRLAIWIQVLFVDQELDYLDVTSCSSQM